VWFRGDCFRNMASDGVGFTSTRQALNANMPIPKRRKSRGGRDAGLVVGTPGRFSAGQLMLSQKEITRVTSSARANKNKARPKLKF